MSTMSTTTGRPVCKPSNHLFVPILEVTVPLLRCIHCNVFAYQETVKQLARNRKYRDIDHEDMNQHREKAPRRPSEPVAYWRRAWINLRRNLGFA